MSQTPGRTLAAAENQATYQTYLDGWADLNDRLVRGEPWSGNERNVAFLNSGGTGADLDFADMGGVLGLDAVGDGRSAAALDIDFDGDEDIVLTNRTEPRLQIFSNRLADGVPTLAVRLMGAPSGPGRSGSEAIGGVVYATPVTDLSDSADPPSALLPGRTLRRTRTVGSGYLAQTSAWLRFAFPDSAWPTEARRGQRVKLEVRWPGATEREDFGLVRMGTKRLILEQGKGVAREITAPRPVRLEAAELPPFELSAARGRRLALPAPSSIPSLEVRGASGRAARLFGMTPDGPRGATQPVIVVVWDSSKPDALVRLGAMGDLSLEAEAAGALVIAIDLADEGPEEEFPTQLLRGAALLNQAGFEGDELAALGSTREILGELVAWRMGRVDPPELPWSLVVGADGRLDAVRTGPWSPGDAERDFVFCKTQGNARLLLASPFGGRWVNPPLASDLARLQARLAKRGLQQAVRELDLARVTTAEATSAEVQIRLGQTQLGSKDYEKALRSFDNALSDDPESAIAQKARAYTLQLLERYDESIEAWGRAIVLDPGDVNSRVNRAFAAIEGGHLDAARADLEVLVATQGGGSEAALAVSRALEAK